VEIYGPTSLFICLSLSPSLLASMMNCKARMLFTVACVFRNGTNWQTSNFKLLQTGTHGILSRPTARYGVRVLEPTRSGIRSTKSPPPAVVVYTSAARSAIPSDNHRSSLVSCCSIHRLKLIACSPQSSPSPATYRQWLDISVSTR